MFERLNIYVTGAVKKRMLSFIKNDKGWRSGINSVVRRCPVMPERHLTIQHLAALEQVMCWGCRTSESLKTKSGIEIKRQIQDLRNETMVCSLSPPAQPELSMAAARPHTVSGTSPSNQSCWIILQKKKKEEKQVFCCRQNNQLTCTAITFLLINDYFVRDRIPKI